MAESRTACASDVQKLCAGVPSGGGRIIACKCPRQSLPNMLRSPVLPVRALT
jgi:hypothetical protein